MFETNVSVGIHVLPLRSTDSKQSSPDSAAIIPKVREATIWDSVSAPNRDLNVSIGIHFWHKTGSIGISESMVFARGVGQVTVPLFRDLSVSFGSKFDAKSI